MNKLAVPKFIGLEMDGRHKQIVLHKDAVTQGFALVAKRGQGKSNLMGDMAETFAARGQSFVILDPPDAHWGIRFKAGPDGRPSGPSGFNVLLVGGDHGDIPLDSNNGKEYARIIVEGDISAVICMKALGYTARQQFCADFGEELFRLNRTPRHIFFEEAHNFLPQRLEFPEQKRVLYAMYKIIGEGRGSGLGFTLASQRPAKVNKDALEEVDNFMVLGMIGPNDLQQVEDWFKRHVRGNKEKLSEIIEDVAGMAPGDCWFLSPAWLKTIVKFHARLRVTYHAGRTPKPGERAVNVSKFSVGDAVTRLTKLFKQKAEQHSVESTNLKEANRRIRELEREVRQRPKTEVVSVAPKNSVSRADLSRVERMAMESQKNLKHMLKEAMKIIVKVTALGFEDTALKPEQIAAALEATAKEIAKAAKSGLAKRQGEFDALKREANAVLSRLKRVLDTEDVRVDLSVVRNEPVSVRPPAPIAPPRRVNGESTNGDGKLRAGAERMLAALAQWNPNGMREGQMRSHAGMKKSGTFSTYMSDLRRGGFIEERNGEIFATALGLEYCKHVPQAPQTTEEVLAVWNPKLRDGARRMLEILVKARGEPMTTEELSAQAGLHKSGTYSTYLSDLRTARLIVSHSKGSVAADKETLFL